MRFLQGCPAPAMKERGGGVLALLLVPPERFLLRCAIWSMSIVWQLVLCSRPCSGAGDPRASYWYQEGQVWTGRTLPSVSPCFEKSKTWIRPKPAQPPIAGCRHGAGAGLGGCCGGCREVFGGLPAAQGLSCVCWVEAVGVPWSHPAPQEGTRGSHQVTGPHPAAAAEVTPSDVGWLWVSTKENLTHGELQACVCESCPRDLGAGG